MNGVLLNQILRREEHPANRCQCILIDEGELPLFLQRVITISRHLITKNFSRAQTTTVQIADPLIRADD